MFQTEDLPLFSGTAQTITINTHKPQPAHRQESFAKCRFCLDTGLLGESAFCWCEAGQARESQKDIT